MFDIGILTGIALGVSVVLYLEVVKLRGLLDRVVTDLIATQLILAKKGSITIREINAIPLEEVANFASQRNEQRKEMNALLASNNKETNG